EFRIRNSTKFAFSAGDHFAAVIIGAGTSLRWPLLRRLADHRRHRGAHILQLSLISFLRMLAVVVTDASNRRRHRHSLRRLGNGVDPPWSHHGSSLARRCAPPIAAAGAPSRHLCAAVARAQTWCSHCP
ncbi:hypothetical protein Dimus_003809, partial [Dionaea muscipula]